MQTRVQSMIESMSNVVVGYGVALAAQVAVFPLFGWQPSLAVNAKISAVFTVVSLLRSYALRRFFNWIHGRRYNR